MRYKQTLQKAHDKDPKPSFARIALRRTNCIQCGKKFELGQFVVYTQLHNYKIIWWHDRPSCTPDNPEEYEN